MRTRSRLPTWFLVLLLPFLTAPSTPAQEQAPLPAELAPCIDPVQTAAGLVQGDADLETGTCVWKGVPYAAPPVGPRRWRPPQSPEPWDGVRAAREFAPRCMQKGAMELINHDPSGEMSEDCLTLNIWRKATGGPYPVFVWIHGGALSGGTANTPMYHGGRLAARGGLVVVSINYRLNIFGFFASPALRDEDAEGMVGNYGLLDQIAALEWIQENIAAFGGDPSRVTIAGESAGGWSVCNLLATPLAAGLFHGAIIESGGCHDATTLERGFEVSAEAAGRLELDLNDLEALRAIPAKKLLRKGVQWENKGIKWLPRIDGVVLTAQPIDLLMSGAYNQVPLLAGANRDEAHDTVFLDPFQFFHGRKRYQKRLRKMFGADEGSKIASLYDRDTFDHTIDAYRKVATDVALLCPTMGGARAVASHQPDVWLYRFDYDDFRFGSTVGACHGMEIPFVFGTFDAWPMRPFYSRRRIREAESLADTIMGYWIAFAHQGDPNSPGALPWPPLSEGNQFMRFDETSSVEALDAQTLARCDYWQAYAEANPWIVETLGFLQGAPEQPHPEGGADEQGTTHSNHGGSGRGSDAHPNPG